MELLDVYDEERNYIGTYSRDKVHEEGMWHNTVHCWLYDKKRYVYFQIREDADKLYTTASGHVQAGESIKEAFGREINEELGINVEYNDAELLDIVVWRMDKEKNHKIIRDRAFANVYLLKVNIDDYKFTFPDGEVKGIVGLDAREVLDLFNDKLKDIEGILITKEKRDKIKINKNDFLLMPGEDVISKYGQVVEAIKEK